MGKAIIPIVRDDASPTLVLFSQAASLILYQTSAVGLTRLQTAINRALRDLSHSPPQFATARPASTPFFIDWDRIHSSDSENLCRELLTQMGFRRVDWHTRVPGIDLVAEYPRKDPDGFEYRELWLVSMGLHATELLFPISDDAEGLLRRLLTYDTRLERLWSHESTSMVTILFIALHGEHLPSILREQFAERSRSGRYPSFLRLRYWDRDYLTNLVQRFPNIGYKYFSDQARSLSNYRKSPDELHKETLLLSERLASTNAELEEEKNRRVRAERDAVWKDIAFSAAHKLGNPLFAIETDLAPLRKRVAEGRTREATEVMENLFRAIEKAKSIVEQFKSLAKAQQVNARATPLRPLFEECCKTPAARGVQCRIDCPDDVQILGDADRLAEVFDELSTNALHWLGDSVDREITVSANGEASTLPSDLDTDQKYVLVNFRDNGPGVPSSDKNSIFDAFYTTHIQGTGLGLALVRRVIEGHGGKILESGPPGRGADFEIYLPVADESVG